MRLIGRECKYSNVLSGPILIDRKLNQEKEIIGEKWERKDFSLFELRGKRE